MPGWMHFGGLHAAFNDGCRSLDHLKWLRMVNCP